MRDDERIYAAICHFFATIPFWGVVGAAVVWMFFKERSREVVFHAQQAIFFQISAVSLFLLWIVASLFVGIIRVINERLADVISSINLFFLAVGFVIYAAICLYGAVRTLRGEEFLYPVIGPRMAEGYRRHSDE